ncbi:hypothetical protein BKA69DRAFT_1060570 [Paraphysoderma sedebokerense]|nr:hypothetical protein BKA69DRAFT_1060570 [Paraphysoderma sedebokerense]
MQQLTVLLVIIGILSGYTTAHNAIVEVNGLNGVKGKAFGVDESTDRSCTNLSCQRDSSLILTSACGRTLQNLGRGRSLNIQNEIKSLSSSLGGQLPSVAAGQPLKMVVHQVNGDGAGPFDCDIDPTATGQNFQKLQVTTQPPGRNGRGGEQATPHPLEVVMPASLSCQGGDNNNVCLIRCKNRLGRSIGFGGCVPVQLDSQNPGNQPGNGTQNAAASTAPKVNPAPAAEEAPAQPAAGGRRRFLSNILSFVGGN